MAPHQKFQSTKQETYRANKNNISFDLLQNITFLSFVQNSKDVKKNNISFDLLQNTTSQQGFPAATRETQGGQQSNISFDVLQNMNL